MAQEPIAYQGIINLETPLIHHVKSYLEEKEQRLARQIADLIPFNIGFSQEESILLAKPSALFHLSLKEGLDVLKSTVHKKLSKDVVEESWKPASRWLNLAFWDYFEALETCGQVLFEQVEQMSLEKWHDRLKNVVESIYNDLIAALSRLKLAFSEAEMLFMELKQQFDEDKNLSYLKKVQSWIKTQNVLDPKFIAHLGKTKEYFRLQFEAFSKNFSKYLELKSALKLGSLHLEESIVLKGIDPEAKEKFEVLWTTLKSFEINQSLAAFTPEKILRQLRVHFYPDKALWVFRTYYQALRRTLFQTSRSLKHSQVSSTSQSVIENCLAVIKGTLSECHVLNHVRKLYEEAIILSDPNPYVRTRLGLDKDDGKIIDLESKPFILFRYDMERLEGLLRHLKESLEQPHFLNDGQSLAQGIDACQEVFHEMGHPLTSYSAMEAQSTRLCGVLKQIDELTSSAPNSIEEVGKALLHAIRLDWKFHVLFSLKEFWDLLDVHQGLLGKSDDREHFLRIAKIKQILKALKDGMKDPESLRGLSEMEEGFDELKESVQKFYMDMQKKRQKAGDDTLKRLSVRQESLRELFELRILFGKFFAQIQKMEGDKTQIRYQILFIDQYFDAIERVLEPV